MLLPLCASSCCPATARIDSSDMLTNVLAFSEPGRFGREDVKQLLNYLGLGEECANLGPESKSEKCANLGPESKSEKIRLSKFLVTLELDKHLKRDPLVEKGLQLAQALFSDPDVLIVERFFLDEGIQLSSCDRMLQAMIAWQAGGPDALLAKVAHKGVKRPGQAKWHSADGGIVRTLLLQLDDAALQHFGKDLVSLTRLYVGDGNRDTEAPIKAREAS